METPDQLFLSGKCVDDTLEVSWERWREMRILDHGCRTWPLMHGTPVEIQTVARAVIFLKQYGSRVYSHCDFAFFVDDNERRKRLMNRWGTEVADRQELLKAQRIHRAMGTRFTQRN